MDLTPVEWVEERRVWLKRDDLYQVAGVRGGKARACWMLAQGARRGLVTAGARHSPQVQIVAHVARALGLPCRVHVPWAASETAEIASAVAACAQVVTHRPGYNSVIIARAKADAVESGFIEIPFGMECKAAVEGARQQVGNLSREAERIVIPVGSGMTLAGVLWGLADLAHPRIPVLGVVVGASPIKRLDRWAPTGWREQVDLVPSCWRYGVALNKWVGEVQLDPIYEAKAEAYLNPGDLLWVVGRRLV